MARTLITTGELIVAANHPNFPDVKNRYGQELWASFIAGHTAEGEQLDPYNIFPIPDKGTYEGTGAALPVAFNVTSYTEILLLMIWSEEDGNLYMVTGDSSPSMKSNVAETGQMDRVTSTTITGFTVGTAAEVNTLSATYYFFVLGLGTTPDAGSNASPPAWIDHDVPMLGGNASAMANSVEDELNTVFQVGHTEAGVHLTAEFAGLGKAEQGVFVPDGSVSQVVNLEDSALDVDTVLLFSQSAVPVYYATASMAQTHDFTDTAISGLPVVTAGTGSFIVNSSTLGTPENMLTIHSDTTDGSTTFVDSSSHANTVTLDYGAVQHSITTAYTGASSIRFQCGISPYYWQIRTIFDGLSALKVTGDINFIFYIKCNVSVLIERGLFTIYPYLQRFEVSEYAPAGETVYYGLCLSMGYSPFSIIAYTTVYKTALGSSGVTKRWWSGSGRITTTTAVNDNAWHKVQLLTTGTVGSVLIDDVVEATGELLYTQFSTDNLNYLSIGGAQSIGTTAGVVSIFVNPYETDTSTLVYIDEISFNITPAILPKVNTHYIVTGS